MKTCPECGKGVRKNHAGLVCQVCVRNEEVRKKYDIRTAADFSLINDLSPEERQILFLWAIGQDVSDYFKQRNTVTPSFDLDMEMLNNPDIIMTIYQDRGMTPWAKPTLTKDNNNV